MLEVQVVVDYLYGLLVGHSVEECQGAEAGLKFVRGRDPWWDLRRHLHPRRLFRPTQIRRQHHGHHHCCHHLLHLTFPPIFLCSDAWSHFTNSISPGRHVLSNQASVGL